MLDLVSLTPTEAGRRVRDYSLGMRQRLGIAHALLGDPEVLILDEPANGLDPAGIRWMRDLLRGYADRGATVLLSSHLLHEIEVVADDIIVIGNGRIVAQGTKAELLASAGTHVRTRHPADLQAALDSPGCVQRDLARRRARRRRPRARRSPGHGRPHPAHRATTRRDGRSRGDVPRAHRRHPTRRSSSMTTQTLSASPAASPEQASSTPARVARIPLRRIVAVELRKSFDTRAGLWLLASVGILSLLTTGAVIAFSPDDDFSYSTFTTTIAFPMSVILPIIAALAVTAEWTQRSGLTTFTIVPHRGRIMLGKAVALVAVAVPATALAFVVGAGGNVVALVDLRPRRRVGPAAGRRAVPPALTGAVLGDGPGVRHAHPQLGRRDRRLLRLLLRLSTAPGPAGRDAGLVRGRAALGRPRLPARRPAQGSVRLRAVAAARRLGGLWLVLPLVAGLWTLLRSEVK